GPPLAHARSNTAPHSETPQRDSLHPRSHGRVATLRGVPLPVPRPPQAPPRFWQQAILPAQPIRASRRLQASGVHSAHCQCRGGLHSWQSYNQKSLRPATELGSLAYSSPTKTFGESNYAVWRLASGAAGSRRLHTHVRRLVFSPQSGAMLGRVEPP